ncbi:hypothetical protein PINS_up008926 [Pythium insidiosum]|nr:hypothetical protein PINS_up008926 [Pythium insidiosum]
MSLFDIADELPQLRQAASPRRLVTEKLHVVPATRSGNQELDSALELLDDTLQSIHLSRQVSQSGSNSSSSSRSNSPPSPLHRSSSVPQLTRSPLSIAPPVHSDRTPDTTQQQQHGPLRQVFRRSLSMGLDAQSPVDTRKVPPPPPHPPSTTSPSPPQASSPPVPPSQSQVPLRSPPSADLDARNALRELQEELDSLNPQDGTFHNKELLLSDKYLRHRLVCDLSLA